MARWVNIDNVTYIEAEAHSDGTYNAYYHVVGGDVIVTYCQTHEDLMKVVNFSSKES